MAAEVIGWDIGGAHLKVARVDAVGRVSAVAQVPCALWRGMHELERAFATVASAIAGASRHAVTMSGESADVFADRASGVAALCDWVATRLPGGASVFDREAGLIDLARAARRPATVGSANWAVTGAWVARRLAHALVVDVGSTTTDLVPVVAGRCAAKGGTDHARLAARELVYAGVVRTPVMAMATSVIHEERAVPLCAELFATSGDVYRLLGRLAPEHDQAETADGRGRSPRESAARLARMLGLDLADTSEAAMRFVAEQFAQRQAEALDAARDEVLRVHPALGGAPILALGAGAFLAAELAARAGVPHVPFAALAPCADPSLRSAITLAGPAVAAALLAHDAPHCLEEMPPCGS
jgi:probable H4MPT-linked C1 transfer pathway protein